MKHGARNDIPAEVVEIRQGGVMAQVHVVAKAVNVLLVSA